jgi:glycosyltransferase involved in cell wall biosynthesis
MKQNLPSIIIPVYNREELVISSIKSILMQNEESCEVIVVDDGSTVGTWSNLTQYEQCARIRAYRFNKNKGVNAARN